MGRRGPWNGVDQTFNIVLLKERGVGVRRGFHGTIIGFFDSKFNAAFRRAVFKLVGGVFGVQRVDNARTGRVGLENDLVSHQDGGPLFLVPGRANHHVPPGGKSPEKAGGQDFAGSAGDATGGGVKTPGNVPPPLFANRRWSWPSPRPGETSGALLLLLEARRKSPGRRRSRPVLAPRDFMN